MTLNAVEWFHQARIYLKRANWSRLITRILCTIACWIASGTWYQLALNSLCLASLSWKCLSGTNNLESLSNSQKSRISMTSFTWGHLWPPKMQMATKIIWKINVGYTEDSIPENNSVTHCYYYRASWVNAMFNVDGSLRRQSDLHMQIKFRLY